METKNITVITDFKPIQVVLLYHQSYSMILIVSF